MNRLGLFICVAAFLGGGLVCSNIPLPFNTPTPPVNGPPPFYGMDFVPPSDLSVVSQFGVEVVSQTFAHDAAPQEWLAQLDEAQKNHVQVIAWLWPQGWIWDGETWQIDAQARAFLLTAADHPALFAVYALNEPYWGGCWQCGYSTQEQQQLYAQIKEIKNVPVFSAVDSMAYWTRQSRKTAFSAGVCDYCASWYYPFRSTGYERDEMIKRLKADLKIARQRAPESKFVWLMQSFSQASSDLRMPSAAEMSDMASAVYEAGVDGAMWYVWTFDYLYDDHLSRHPELFPVVRQIYLDSVATRR